MQTSVRDRLYIKKGERKIYEKLLGRGSPFHGQANKVPFLMSMLVGYQEGINASFEQNRDGWILASYLSDREQILLKAIAVDRTKSLDVLTDMNKVYSIAEGYASGGLTLLQNDIFNPKNYASYEKRLELLLTTLAKNYFT